MMTGTIMVARGFPVERRRLGDVIIAADPTQKIEFKKLKRGRMGGPRIVPSDWCISVALDLPVYW